MSSLRVGTSTTSRDVVVTLTGDCDLQSRDQLTEALLTAVASAEVVRVDLAGVTFIDSSGLHGLVVAHHAARRRDARLYVVNATGPVAAVLDVTGVGDLLSPGGGRADG